MTRTDIHRPSAIVPADYDFVGLWTTRLEYGAIFVLQQERARVQAHMQQTGGGFSRHEHGGNCFVCGAHCIYMAVFFHEKTNAYIRTGMDCAAKLEMGDADRFRVFRDAVEAARKHRAGKKKAEGVLLEEGLKGAWEVYARWTDLPEMEKSFVACCEAEPNEPVHRLVYADWLEEQGDSKRAQALRDGHHPAYQGPPPPPQEERTICDIVEKLVRWGSLSPAQVRFLHVLLKKIAERPAREAKRAEEDAKKEDVPSGRQTLEVEVVKTETKINYDGSGRPVMTVKALKGGFLLWGTVPSSVCLVPTEDGEGNRALTRGDKLTLTATLERSDRDPKFGFFKRPIARLI